jgi:hypothetical protein
MNGWLAESELPEAFERNDYRVLLVAEKYQTGFDQDDEVPFATSGFDRFLTARLTSATAGAREAQLR